MGVVHCSTLSWFNIWIRGDIIKMILHYFVEGENERKLIETTKNKYLYSGKIKILVFQNISVNPIQSKAILQIIRTQYILKIVT